MIYTIYSVSSLEHVYTLTISPSADFPTSLVQILLQEETTYKLKSVESTYCVHANHPMYMQWSTYVLHAQPSHVQWSMYTDYTTILEPPIKDPLKRPSKGQSVSTIANRNLSIMDKRVCHLLWGSMHCIETLNPFSARLTLTHPDPWYLTPRHPSQW